MWGVLRGLGSGDRAATMFDLSSRLSVIVEYVQIEIYNQRMYLGYPVTWKKNTLSIS